MSAIVPVSNLLAEKHALVTGGARGIGAAVTSMLLAHGARVTAIGRAANAKSTPDLDFDKTSELAYASADVTNAEEVAKACKAARKHFGPVKILINNAGQASSSPFLKTTAKQWRDMMDVNLDGTFHCSQSVLPDMLEAEWGRVVNVASVAGLIGYSYVSAYCAAKHAVIGLTRSLAREYAMKGITVNAVCPGYTETEMLEQTIENIVAKTGRTREEAIAALVAGNPQNRLIKPEEVANAIAWLCLPGSESITGQAISVSGGEVT